MGNHSNDLVALLRRLIERAADLCRRQSRLDDKWDDIALELTELLDQIGQLDVPPSTSSTKGRQPRNGFSRRPLELKPDDLAIQWIHPRRARVRLGDLHFELSFKLASLLSVLASGDPGEDGLAPWKSTSDLVAALDRERAATSNARRAVYSLIHRLRDSIRKNEGLAEWIQSVEGLGYRLAYRPKRQS